MDFFQLDIDLISNFVKSEKGFRKSHIRGIKAINQSVASIEPTVLQKEAKH